MGLIRFIFGLIGGIIGLVFGLIGGAFGLVFGLFGTVFGLIVIGVVFVLLLPLILLFIIL